MCNTKDLFKSSVFAFIFAYALINKNENKCIHGDTGRIVKSQHSRLLHTVYFIFPLGRNIYIRYLNLILLCIKYFQFRIFVRLVRWPPRSHLVSETLRSFNNAVNIAGSLIADTRVAIIGLNTCTTWYDKHNYAAYQSCITTVLSCRLLNYPPWIDYMTSISE